MELPGLPGKKQQVQGHIWTAPGFGKGRCFSSVSTPEVSLSYPSVGCSFQGRSYLPNHAALTQEKAIKRLAQEKCSEAGNSNPSGYPGCRTLTDSRGESCPVLSHQNLRAAMLSLCLLRASRHWRPRRQSVSEERRTKTKWVLKLRPQTLNYAPPAFHKQDYAGLAYFEIWPLLIRLGCPSSASGLGCLPSRALAGLFHLHHPLTYKRDHQVSWEPSLCCAMTFTEVSELPLYCVMTFTELSNRDFSQDRFLLWVWVKIIEKAKSFLIEGDFIPRHLPFEGNLSHLEQGCIKGILLQDISQFKETFPT